MNIGARGNLKLVGGLAVSTNQSLLSRMTTIYDVECYRGGRLLWAEHFHNLVTTVGLNKLLDATFKNGLASPAWFVGLKATGSLVSGDTMGSHGGWTEITAYSGARPAYTPGTISGGSVDNSAAKATFNMTGPTTVYGCFLADDNTVGGITGTLYGGGDFSLARAVINGDVLFATLTLTAG